MFFGKSTADKFDLNDLRSGVQRVCLLFKQQIGPITLPSGSDKIAQGFTKMTTQRLLSLSPKYLLGS